MVILDEEKEDIIASLGGEGVVLRDLVIFPTFTLLGSTGVSTDFSSGAEVIKLAVVFPVGGSKLFFVGAGRGFPKTTSSAPASFEKLLFTASYIRVLQIWMCFILVYVYKHVYFLVSCMYNQPWCLL